MLWCKFLWMWICLTLNFIMLDIYFEMMFFLVVSALKLLNMVQGLKAYRLRPSTTDEVSLVVKKTMGIFNLHMDDSDGFQWPPTYFKWFIFAVFQFGILFPSFWVPDF